MDYHEAQIRATVRSMYQQGMSLTEIIEHINLWTEDTLAEQP